MSATRTNDPVEHTGSCLCGRVKLGIYDTPLMRMLCHCLSCQKAQGSAFAANILCKQENVKIEDLESVIRCYKDTSPDSGNFVERFFCSVCGSNMYTTNPNIPLVQGKIIVMQGVLDGDRSQLTPDAEFYVKRRHPWCDGVGAAQEYQEMI